MSKTGFEKFAEKAVPLGRVEIKRPSMEKRLERENLDDMAGDREGSTDVAPAAMVEHGQEGAVQKRRGRPRKGESPSNESFQMHIRLDADTRSRLEEEMRRRHLPSLNSVIMTAIYEFLSKE